MIVHSISITNFRILQLYSVHKIIPNSIIDRQDFVFYTFVVSLLGNMNIINNSLDLTIEPSAMQQLPFNKSQFKKSHSQFTHCNLHTVNPK